MPSEERRGLVDRMGDLAFYILEPVVNKYTRLTRGLPESPVSPSTLFASMTIAAFVGWLFIPTEEIRIARTQVDARTTIEYTIKEGPWRPSHYFRNVLVDGEQVAYDAFMTEKKFRKELTELEQDPNAQFLLDY